MKRVGNAFKGVLGGFITIGIGIVLLWWNEGNNVKNLKTTAEMSKSVINVGSDRIDESNEGKLIATSGTLINEQTLNDETFDIHIKTPKLNRVVEMYQWEEDCTTDDDGNESCSYSKVWSESLIGSSSFHDRSHTNPSVRPYNNESHQSTDVKVGAFSLTSDQISDLSTNGTYTNFNLEKVNELKLTVSGTYITNSKNLNSPEIGDVRISFKYNNSTDVSVLAVQKGSSFVDFVSKAGKNINRVMDGVKTGEEMINVIKKENNILKWILRLVGAIMCMAGVGAILKPISAITSYVPILGNIVGAAVGLVAGIVGLAISLVVIAIAWIRFRPVLGFGLLGVVVALIVLLIIRPKNKKAEPVQQTTTQEQVSDTTNNNM